MLVHKVLMDKHMHHSPASSLVCKGLTQGLWEKCDRLDRLDDLISLNDFEQRSCEKIKTIITRRSHDRLEVAGCMPVDPRWAGGRKARAIETPVEIACL
jgi:hypothetical protein